MNPSAFWNFTIGNIASVVVILGFLLTLHSKNTEKIRSNTVMFQTIEESLKKIETLEAKIESLGLQLAQLGEMRTKMDLMYLWFENNVVGRGEAPRRGGGVDKP